MENPVRVAIRDSTENLVNIPLQTVDERHNEKKTLHNLEFNNIQRN